MHPSRQAYVEEGEVSNIQTPMHRKRSVFTPWYRAMRMEKVEREGSND